VLGGATTVSEAEHGTRLARVEKEVGGIQNEITGLKAQMRGFGDILNRIEQGVAAAQQRFDDDKQAARINPIAVAAILITIITTLVGGAWVVSGELSKHDAVSEFQQKMLDRMEQRQWEGGHRGSQAPAST
jgi:hypothetical protein